MWDLLEGHTPDILWKCTLVFTSEWTTTDHIPERCSVTEPLWHYSVCKKSNEHILPRFCCRQNHNPVFLNTLCSYLIRLINIKTLICTGSISLHSKLVKWQEASRGISLSRIYSAFKCLSNYKKITIVFSLTHNQMVQELLTPREDSAAFHFSLRWHMTSTQLFSSKRDNLTLQNHPVRRSFDCSASGFLFDFNDVHLLWLCEGEESSYTPSSSEDRRLVKLRDISEARIQHCKSNISAGRI